MVKAKRPTRAAKQAAVVTTVAPIEATTENEEPDVFEVEKIVDKRDSTKGVEYYVKWQGYPSSANTWEPVGNIIQKKLIKDFEATQKVTGAVAAAVAAASPLNRSNTSKRKLPPSNDDEDEIDNDDVPMVDEDLVGAEDGENKNKGLNLSPIPKRGMLKTKVVPKRKKPAIASNMISTPKLKPSTNRGASIRSNLQFSPSPQPAESSAKKPRGMVIKKVYAAPKRGSLGGVITKIGRSRKSISKPKVRDETYMKFEVENSSPDISIVQDENGPEKMELEQVEEKNEDEDEQLEAAEKSPVKAKRGRVTKAKPAKVAEPKQSAPARKATARSKKVETVKGNTQTEVMNFKKLKVTRVIDESTESKMITFLGTYNNENAVIRLEKTSFDEGLIKKALIDKDTVANQDFANDIYASYMVQPTSSAKTLNDIKATVIWPATEAVLAKYTRSDTVFFSETPEIYSKTVEPYITNLLANEIDHITWVYNILDGKSEVERVILDDPDPDSGFMLVPDLKWTGDEKDLYLIAICHRRDIRSLRDLNDKHLVLLKNIMTKGTKVIKDKYKKAKDQLRSYIHYHPSFYHFHVHFKMVDASEYRSTDRDNLLSTVINNITMNKDYYKKSTLTYPLSQTSALFKELKIPIKRT